MAKRTCTIADCERIFYCRGMCVTHYNRWRRLGSTDLPVRAIKPPCAVDGCGRISKAVGLCKPHYQRDWYERNLVHALAYANGRYDSEAARERHERLKTDPQYLAKRKLVYDRWRSEHPEKAKAATDAWRANNQGRVTENTRKWIAANRETIRVMKRGFNRARRAKMSGAGVDYAAILAEFGMVCHICTLVIESMADLHMDHVIPLAKGGPHIADNIRPSHAFCNMSKGAKIA